MQQENKLGTMPIRKLIWNMSLPIIISMTVQALYNVVDSIFVAMISENALTAVSLAFSAQQLIIGVGAGTSVGVNALLSRSLGAREFDRANRIAVHGIYLAICSGIVTAIIGALISRTFFVWQTSVEDIINLGESYLQVVTICSIGIYSQMMLERLLQGTGRSTLSMYSQGLGAIVNLILDPVFIFVFHMGVRGAAIATVIGQICSMILGFYLNIKKNTDITFVFKGFRPDQKLIGNIYAIGVPSIIMIGLGSITNFLLNKIIITYHAAHETAVAAYGVYFKINSFVFMPLTGMNNGIVPIIAYNYGARSRARLEEAIRRCVIYSAIIMFLGLAMLHLFPVPILKLFSATEAMMSVGVHCLRIISISFLMAGVCIALSTVLQALGAAVYSMITSFVRQLIFLVPSAYILARIGIANGNSNLIWWSYGIAEIASAILCITFYLHVHKTIIKKIPYSK